MNSVTEFFYDYSSMASEVKRKATKGRGLKILTPNASKITNSSCTSSVK